MIAFLLKIEQYLSGWPDAALTISLLVIAAILVLIALAGKPMEKAIAIAYCVFP